MSNPLETWIIVAGIVWLLAAIFVFVFNYGAHTYDRSVDPFLNEEKKSE